MHKWYTVQVMSSQEKRVKKTLEENREKKGMADLIEEILVPTENVSEVKRGQQKITERCVWPGYVFVKMNLNDDSWMYIKHTSGVIGFLGGEHPTPLHDGEMLNILEKMEAKGTVQKHNIQAGHKVKIIDGPFQNFTGTVREVFHDKGRLVVMVAIFGRESPVDLEFAQVEQVQEEA